MFLLFRLGRILSAGRLGLLCAQSKPRSIVASTYPSDEFFLVSAGTAAKKNNYTIQMTRAGGHGLHPCALDPVFNRVLFAGMLGFWSRTILS